MDVAARTRRRIEVKERESGNERTKVAVVYYLSKNGHLEHPHFMEISIPLSEGLYLRDVIKSLDSLRGKGMAKMYAWSSKRSYKNGYVWQDLTENDFIYPSAHGNEYILKGSELFIHDQFHYVPLDIHNKISARRSFDLSEHKEWKNKPYVIKEEKEEETPITVLDQSEVSPACSSSSSSTLETLIKADGHCAPAVMDENSGNAVNFLSKKIKTPAEFMHLISRKLKFRQAWTTSCEDMNGSEGVSKEEHLNVVSEKYESTGEFSGLRKSYSCNAERGLKMELAEKEIDGVRARCIPRKPKANTSTQQMK